MPNVPACPVTSKVRPPTPHPVDRFDLDTVLVRHFPRLAVLLAADPTIDVDEANR